MAAASPTSLSELYHAIANGEMQQVGFLSDGNYESVKVVLPPNTEKIIFGHVSELYEAVKNGTVIAGMTSGIPEEDGLHVFSSTLVSPRTSLLKKDIVQESDDEDATIDSEDLRKAWDAAITRAIGNGKYAEIEEAFEPFEGVASFSCTPNNDAFIFPDPENATGLLKSVIQSGVLKVAALGPYNWGVDGNYQADPFTGFWPEYMDAIFIEFQSKYTGVEMERVWFETSGETMDCIDSGACHLTEPYWLQPSLYNGIPRVHAFKMSCTTMGYESRFFTRIEYPPPPPPSDDNGLSDDGPSDDGLSDGAIAAIVVSSVAAFVFLLFVIYLVYFERRGAPVFTPLITPPPKKISQKSLNNVSLERI